MSKGDKKKLARRLANAYLSSIISIALVLLLIGVACLILLNASSASDYFKENMRISVLMKENVTEEQAESYRLGVAGLPFVRTAELITREQGTQELQEMLGKDFLEVFETSPVPVSVELTLDADYVSSDSLSVVLPQFEDGELVDEVNCQENLVEALNSNLARIALILGVFVLLMLFISFVLINNTVRLSVSARRFTVHTMQLVGATRRFIRKPFMKAAFWQGLAASVLALLCIAGLLALLRRSFPQMFALFSPQGLAMVAGVVVFCGVAICLVSSYFVVNRLISLNKDDLYY